MPLSHAAEFFCLACDPTGVAATFTREGLHAHLIAVHRLPRPMPPATRTLVSHLDLAHVYESRYVWRFGELRVLEIATGPL